MTTIPLTPKLIVRGVDDAIAFYGKAFGAETLERFYDPRLERVVHAALSLCGAVVALSEHDPEWHNHAPDEATGSPVVLQLEVADPDAVAADMVAAGAREVIPVDDRFYGKRDGRLVDPLGHVWIVFRSIETLSHSEIQARVDRSHD